jgi:hypothetical protein
MEEPRDNKPSTVVKIAADGDVILVVEPEQVKLRVHSRDPCNSPLARYRFC